MNFFSKHKTSSVAFLFFFLFFTFIIYASTFLEAPFFLYILPIFITSIIPFSIIFLIEVIIHKLKKALIKKNNAVPKPKNSVIISSNCSDDFKNPTNTIVQNKVVKTILSETLIEKVTDMTDTILTEISNDNTFVAIDFETATQNNNSACSIGIIVVTNGEIVDKQYFLIQPPLNKYNDMNISIHSITPKDTADVGSFALLWPKISHFFNNTYVTAHNALFDMRVLKATLHFYGIPFPSFKYFCSMSVGYKYANREKLSSKKLKDMCDCYGICLDNHHNALADACACAELVIAAINKSHYTSFNTFINGRAFVKDFSALALKDETLFQDKPYASEHRNHIKISEIADSIPEADKIIDEDFNGKVFVFTGELEYISREDAYERVIAGGGIVKSGVSSKVDFLVNADTALTGKLKRALELQDEGHHITILTGDEFMEMLD